MTNKFMYIAIINTIKYSNLLTLTQKLKIVVVFTLEMLLLISIIVMPGMMMRPMMSNGLIV